MIWTWKKETNIWYVLEQAEIEQLSQANQTRIDSWIGVAGKAFEDVEIAAKTAEEIVRMEEEEKVCCKYTLCIHNRIKDFPFALATYI